MKTFNWYINRLKLMSFSEILYRVANTSKSHKERLFRENLSGKTREYKKINNVLFTDLSYLRDFYEKNSVFKFEMLEKADFALDHKVSFFSLKNKYLGENIDWGRDYLNDRSYELKFYADLDYRNHNMGDIKYVWELNRFQHLYPLMQAFVVFEETRFSDEIIRQIDDWIDKNPYLMGINWTSSLELAIRLISWSWFLSAIEKISPDNNLQSIDDKVVNFNGVGCRGEAPTQDIIPSLKGGVGEGDKNNPLNYKSFSEKVKKKISTSIFQQAEYIYNHISRFSSANNHLIGEAAGLVITGLTFDFGKYSKKWVDKGTKILFEELDKQFFEDGLNKEQAFSYHCFSTDLYLTTFLIMAKHGIDIPQKMRDKVEKAVESISVFVDKTLTSPNFGDGDDGFVLKLDNFAEDAPPVKSITRSLLNTAAAIFNRGDFKYLTGGLLDEKTLWLLGPEYTNNYYNLDPVKPDNNSKYLSESGYLVIKDNDIKGFMDVGNLGYLSIAAHGHADALSFCLNYKNCEFLIDPGTYAYHTNKKWRDYFRSTASHNTLEVNGLDQSLNTGNFMWGQKAEVTVDKVLIDKEFDYIRAHHDGYLKQNLPVKHIRELVYNKNKFILVIDRVENRSGEKHDLALNWHIHPDCRKISGQNLIELENNQNKLFMQVFGDESLTNELLEESLNPVCGWMSKRFDEKEPCSSIRYSTSCGKNTKLVTVISPDEPVEFIYDGSLLKIQAGSEEFLYNLEEFINP